MCRPAFLLDKTGAIIYNDFRCESIKPKSSAADVTQKAKGINLIKNIIKSGCSAVGSAPALGAGCRGFESLHSDQCRLEKAFLGRLLIFILGVNQMSESNMSISEMLTYSTVLINCQYADGSVGSGTGFIVNLCNKPEEKTCIPVLITNNHVVNNSVRTVFEFCKADENGEPLDTESFSFNYSGAGNKWILHPNKNIDLCCLPLGPALNELAKTDIKIFYIPLETDLIPTESKINELSAIEDIVMIGYPIGISDQYNHKPVIRRGITATHPKKDYQGQKHILLDMACFPGSSGSPVFIMNQGSYATPSGITVGNRIYLLGILFGGPQYTAQGILSFANVPNIPKPIVNIPTNLGVAIKSSEILEFEKILDPTHEQ